ncbi:tigger transposable element-derived protein 4-like [Ostrea edulis]|uniref:tigger transposable element-derived protein 4-like n=1 Tax=Ostrea edulis TaxID=37623 RepID=UPI0024AF86C1|nr:tigger transposable element-derived protein 4-like [Ostrea edulis]
MSSPSRKRKAISLETKYEILKEIEKGGRPKKEIAANFSILPNTLSTIIKNKDDIIKNYESLNLSPQRKRHRSVSHQNVDDALLEWFKEKRKDNLPLSGPILLQKADELAKKLSDSSFKGNTGWLDRFKNRHGIVCRTINSESGFVDPQITEDWKEKLGHIIKSYQPCDIFNADETGLFYKLLPEKTLQLKGEDCHGGKRSKERLTVMVSSNMDGSEKLKLLVIRKYENPRCFKGVKSLPVTYKSNKKAWMTSCIFAQWLKDLDRKFTREKRKVLLFIDNCAAHPKIENLKSISLKFFPPNTTSKLQLMDQGIIHNLKVKYRHRLINYMLEVRIQIFSLHFL